jgi:hypothetical protein
MTGSGVVGTVQANTTASIKKLTTGWYECTINYVATAAGTMLIQVAEADSDTTFDGLNQQSIAIWGAYLYARTNQFTYTNSTYIKTNGVTKPRHDLTPGATVPTASKMPLHGNDGNKTEARQCNNAAVGSCNYSKAIHDSLKFWDTDFTITYVYDSDVNFISTTYLLYAFTANTSGGVLYGANTGIIKLELEKAATFTTVSGSTSTDFLLKQHIVQVVRSNNYVKICVDGQCGTPADVTGYGVDGAGIFTLGGTATVNSSINGRWGYTRIDAEALPDRQLAKEREQILGTLSNAGPIWTNVIADGNMEAAGVGSWTVYAGATLTKETTLPFSGILVLRTVRNGTTLCGASQNILTVGRRYNISGWARSDGVCIPSVGLGSNVAWAGTNSTSWQQFSFSAGTPSSNLFYLRQSTCAVDGQYTEWDDVTVIQEEPYNWLYSRGTTATKKFSNNQMATAGIYNPRVGGEGGGIEIEQAVQNKCLQSADFNTSWTKNALTSVSTDSKEDPFGTTTADGTIADVNNTQHGVSQNVTTTATRWTVSVYASPGYKDWVYLSDATIGANCYAYFNVRTGTIGTVGASVTYAKIQPAWCPTTGLCWYRVSISFTSTAAANLMHIYSADADTDNTFAGDTTTINTYLFGAQVEQFPVPSSYIPTTTAAVTRSADLLNLDPSPPNATNTLIPETICGTCASSKLTVQFDAKCRYASSTEIASPVTTTSLLEISSTLVGTNRLRVQITNAGVVGAYLDDSTATTHSSVTAANPVTFNNWFTIKAMFDLADLSRMYMTVGGYAGAYTLVNNAGTATFDNTTTKIRLLQVYNDGAPIGTCWIRNLRIQPYEF